jgi:hypothetical protein
MFLTMSKSLFTLLLLFLAYLIIMSAIEKLLVCEQMFVSCYLLLVFIIWFVALLVSLHTDIWEIVSI